MGFQDHFSKQAADYAKYRPTYPDALFDWLAAEAPSRALALDVATGNGQAALALAVAARFERVVATEPSEAQLAAAPAHPGVVYRQEPAERCSLEDASADLVTVAQALHWFDVPAFLAEAARVLRPGGLLAVWCYTRFASEPALDAILGRFYEDVVGPYWPPERRWLESGYAGLALPASLARLVAVPRFAMEARWTLDELLGYLATWSATQRYRDARAEDPLAPLRRELEGAFTAPATPRAFRWPLELLAARRV